MKIMSGLLVVIKWSVSTVKSQMILLGSFSMTASGWCPYHFGLTCIPFALQISHWVRLPIQSSLRLYYFWASLEHALTMWLIALSALLHILHFVCSCNSSIFLLIILIRMTYSWVAHIKLSVSRFRVPFRNNCQLFWFPTSLVCRTNWPRNILFLLRNCSFLLLLLPSLYWSFSDWLYWINIHRSRSRKVFLI